MKLYFLIVFLFLVIQKARSCYDNSRYARSCPSYRAKGYCASNRIFMAKNCKKTCGLCGALPNIRVKLASNCRNVDSNVDCSYWRNKGYCTYSRYRNFMKTNCYLACGYCKKITVTLKPVVVKKTCKDNSKHASKCNGWKPYCKAPTRYIPNKWFNFMKENCAKTCVFCKPVWVHRTTQRPKTQQSTTLKKTTTTTTTTIAPVQPAVKSECGIDKKNKDGAFLVGGTEAQRHRWVWQVAIYYFDQFICGGSIISPQYILTASHCVRWRMEDGLKVIAGDHVREYNDGGEQEIEVVKLKYHEKYDGQTIDNDIAILKLKTPLTLTKNIGLVCLPQLNGYTPQAKDNCFVTGWGRVRADGDPIDILQEAKMNIVTNEICGKKNIDKLGKSKVTKNMICAGTELDDISGCQGDSGGPLVCKSSDNRWFQHGVVSWGSSECNATLRYTVFAKVNNYIGWIDKNMN